MVSGAFAHKYVSIMNNNVSMMQSEHFINQSEVHAIYMQKLL